MKKGCKNHRETQYSSKGKIVYVVGKPCNIYRLWWNPSLWFLQPFSIDIAGKTYRLPAMPCKHLQCNFQPRYAGYFTNPSFLSLSIVSEYRVSLWFLQPFSIDIAGKIYGHPVNPCKHLQCIWRRIWILCIKVQQYAQLNEANHPIKCELEWVWL